MVPNPFPYQGSKRGLLNQILPYVARSERIVEPFAGSAAVSVCAIAHQMVDVAWLNDLNEPLMRLWERLVNHPQELADEYEYLWRQQMGVEYEYYGRVREEFNRTGDPARFLYLLARCVKGAIRYNAKGEFNQSPDNRRKGRKPSTMRNDILAVSRLLRGKCSFTSLDYKTVALEATSRDLVYMDPPYQGVCGRRDSRYFAGIDHDEFVEVLRELNLRNVPYLVSYDGQTGLKEHGRILPPDLDLLRVLVDAGRSSQATLLGEDKVTIESLYISRALVDKVGASTQIGINSVKQLSFGLAD